MLKSYGVECAGGHVVMCRRPCGGGPCDYCVSPSPFGFDSGTLDFGTSDSGLTIRIVEGQGHRHQTGRGDKPGHDSHHLPCSKNTNKNSEEDETFLEYVCTLQASTSGTVHRVFGLIIRLKKEGNRHQT